MVSSSTPLPLLLVALSLLAWTAEAHLSLRGSREGAFYKNRDFNLQFWPIGPAGGATLRPKRDCLQYPALAAKSMKAGSTVKMPYNLPSVAKVGHIGMCTAELIDLTTKKTYQIAREKDCADRNIAVTVKLPNINCPKCVIKAKLTAVHLGPSKPEFFDSCVDVSVTGGSGGGGGDAGGSTDAGGYKKGKLPSSGGTGGAGGDGGYSKGKLPSGGGTGGAGGYNKGKLPSGGGTGGAGGVDKCDACTVCIAYRGSDGCSKRCPKECQNVNPCVRCYFHFRGGPFCGDTKLCLPWRMDLPGGGTAPKRNTGGSTGGTGGSTGDGGYKKGKLPPGGDTGGDGGYKKGKLPPKKGGDNGGGSTGGGGTCSLAGATDCGEAFSGGTSKGAKKCIKIGAKPVTTDIFCRVKELFAAAKAGGAPLEVVSGFRTMAEQKRLYNAYLAGKGNLAARPGFSNHQNGIALDLNAATRNAQYRWLHKNAKKFGFFRTVPSELWHWEYLGPKGRCTIDC